MRMGIKRGEMPETGIIVRKHPGKSPQRSAADQFVDDLLVVACSSLVVSDILAKGVIGPLSNLPILVMIAKLRTGIAKLLKKYRAAVQCLYSQASQGNHIAIERLIVKHQIVVDTVGVHTDQIIDAGLLISAKAVIRSEQRKVRLSRFDRVSKTEIYLIKPGKGSSWERFMCTLDGIHGQSRNQHEKTDTTYPIPTSEAPSPCAQGRAKSTADETRSHIDGIQTIPCGGIEAINTRLIGDMGGLSAQIEEHYPENQAPQPVSDQPQAEKREQHDEQCDPCDRTDRETVSKPADNGG